MEGTANWEPEARRRLRESEAVAAAAIWEAARAKAAVPTAVGAKLEAEERSQP